MSWNLIYYGNFEDNVNKDRVDIYIKQKDFLGTPEKLLLDANPLVISYPSKDFDDSLFGCGCKINIINDSSDFFRYESLFAVPERNNYVEIIKTPLSGDPSIFLFQGYVLPQMYNSTLEKNIRVTIPAVDQLTTLDRISPAILIDTSSYRCDEYLNALDFMTSIIRDADVVDKIQIHNDLETPNYTKDASSTIFDAVFLFADNFADNNGVENNKKCIEKILKPFYSRCYYNNGVFKIERMADIAKYSKDFIQYVDEGNVTQVNVSNNRVELNNHNIINKSATITYNPGYQRLITNLKFKSPTSLVENYYWDTTYYAKEVSVNTTRPIPKFRKWMMSDTDTSLFFKSWTDTNITSGLYFAPSSAWGINLAKYPYLENQFASTMFQVTPNIDKTILSIKYTMSLEPGEAIYNAEHPGSLNSNFALRVCSKDGINRWLAKSHPDDSSTFWSTGLYLFNSSIGTNDVIDNGYKWEVSYDVDITAPFKADASLSRYQLRDPLNDNYNRFPFTYTSTSPRDRWRRRTLNPLYTLSEDRYVGEIYLDIYPIRRKFWAVSGMPGYVGYSAYNTKFGDVVVDVKADIPNNVLEASLGYYSEVIETELEIFDVSSANFTNGLYSIDDDGTVASIGLWRDNPSDGYLKLQEKYMLDLAQMYGSPRYGLTLDVRSNDSSLFTLGNIYTHSEILYPDDSKVEFICNGMDYNVVENTYRLNLMEFIADDSWRIDVSIAEVGDYFITDISSLAFNFDGTSPDDTIGISTNVTWEVSTNVFWALLNVSENLVDVDCLVNSGAYRSGTITFSPSSNTLSDIVINVTQDSSEVAIVGWDLNGDLNFEGIGFTVLDISLRCYATASVDSYYGWSHTAEATVDWDLNTVHQGGVSAIASCSGVCSSTSSRYYNVSGLTNAALIHADFVIGEYQADSEADVYSNAYIEITGVNAISGGDVSILYSKLEAHKSSQSGEIEYYRY